MVKFIRWLSSSKFFPIFWTVLTLALLCIPGKALPGLGLFGIRNLDKIAHIGLFGGFVLFWALYYWQARRDWSAWLVQLGIICGVSIALGIIMEYVQINFIPNRSFDVWDIWADVVGSVLVMAILIRYGKRIKLLI